MESIAPATGTALLLLVAFVLPGFVTLVIQENAYVVREATTPFERLLLSLSYSVRIYGVLLLIAYLTGWHDRDIARLYHGKRELGTYILVGGLALFVLPVVLSEVGRWWRSSTRLRPAVLRTLRISPGHSTSSGWNHFFGSDTLALVRATLDDGRVVGGYFGSDSLAAYSEHSQDLFLEQRWELDDEHGWFVQPAPASVGIWLPHDHIVSLEVYEPPREGQSETVPVTIVASAVTAVLILMQWLRGQ